MKKNRKVIAMKKKKERFSLTSQVETYGFITPIYERVFYYISMLPPWKLLFTSSKSKEDFRKKSPEEQKAHTKKQATKVEIYVLTWLIAEVVLFVSADRIKFPAIPIILASLRILDIIQSSLNIVYSTASD